MSEHERDPEGPDEGYVQHPVGYGAPPLASRWPKGVSGNPRGPRKKNRTRRYMLEQVAYRIHEISEGNKRKRKTALEIILLRLRTKAIEGNKAASELCERIRGMAEPSEEYIQPAILIVGEKLTEEEWTARYGQ